MQFQIGHLYEINWGRRTSIYKILDNSLTTRVLRIYSTDSKEKVPAQCYLGFNYEVFLNSPSKTFVKTVTYLGRANNFPELLI